MDIALAKNIAYFALYTILQEHISGSLPVDQANTEQEVKLSFLLTYVIWTKLMRKANN